MQASVQPPKQGSKRVLAVTAIAFLIASGVIGATIISQRGPGGAASSDGGSAASITGEEIMAAPSAYASAAPMPAPAPTAPTFDAADKSVSRETTSAAGVSLEVSQLNAADSGPDERIVQTADLSLVVADGGFTEAFSKAQGVADTYGGFIVNSSTEGTHAKAGTVSIRVPVASYGAALKDLTALGIEIESENTSGVNVSSEFVDLNARLRSWEAQQRVLLKLMDKANSISETMQVQNEIQRVQVEIESLKGQLRLLRDQSTLATITVSMHERGATVPKVDTERPSLAVAFDAATAGFLGVISAVIVGLGTLLPLALMALVLWLVARRFRKGGKPQATATPETATG